MQADRVRLTVAPDDATEPSPETALAPLTEVPIGVTIRLGSARLTLGELMELRAGAVLGLDQRVDAPAEIMVGQQVIALGQMVMVGQELGVRVLELGSRANGE